MRLILDSPSLEVESIFSIPGISLTTRSTGIVMISSTLPAATPDQRVMMVIPGLDRLGMRPTGSLNTEITPSIHDDARIIVHMTGLRRNIATKDAISNWEPRIARSLRIFYTLLNVNNVPER